MAPQSRRADLLRLFRSRAYRRQYVEHFYNTRLAAQIRLLREARGSSQQQLGRRLETQQSAISKLENANYSNWSVKTLRRLARAFDVALQVRFVTFGEALADIDQFDRVALLKPAFRDDPVFNVEELSAGQNRVLETTATTGLRHPGASMAYQAEWVVVPAATEASTTASDNLALAS